MQKNSLNLKQLVLSELICFIPGIIGGMVTSTSVKTWYPTLTKSTLNPPGSVFGPVWTILYILQGVSLYLINITSTKDSTAKLMAHVFFYLQLALNLLWSVLFFGLKNPFLAFIEIGLLDITVLFTIISAYRIHKTAGLILLPYMMWISFATYLNASVYFLNR